MALRADDVDLGRDRDLVERFQNGDPEAFDDLYRRYYERLHRFCRRHTADRHEAEEVAQEAFVKAYRNIGSLQGERRFYPWLTVIAKRISIDRHRKLARIELAEEPDVDRASGGVDGELDRQLLDAEDASLVQAALANLGPRHREVLDMREHQHLSYAEIAEAMDVPVSTVEALLHRARKALRREYTTLTGADAKGFWSLPLVAMVAPRIDSLRARVGDRWAEVAMVAAPAAAAAVAVATLAPSPAPAPTEAAVPLPAPAVVAEAEPAELPSAPVVVPMPATPAPTAAVPASTPTTAPAEPVAPAIEAGDVEVFLGPEGSDEVDDRIADDEVQADAGAAAVGLNPIHVLERELDAVRTNIETALDLPSSLLPNGDEQ